MMSIQSTRQSCTSKNTPGLPTAITQLHRAASHAYCIARQLCMGPRTSPGAGVAKDMDHKGLKQLQLLTGRSMSKIFYSPCLVATLRGAGDDAIAKVDTRPKWEAWDLSSIASHSSSRKFGHHGEGSKRRGAKKDGGRPRKLRHSNHPSPCNV